MSQRQHAALTHHVKKWRPGPLSVACLVWALTSCTTWKGAPSQSFAPDIETVVILYAENHSFDNIYGLFPGAEGIAQASEEQKLQLDHDGQPLKELVVFDHHGHPDPQYPRMPNAPFRIDAPPVNRSPNMMVPNPVHAFYQNQEQINGGKNNLFAAMSNVGGWTMGYYDGSQFRLWKWAQEYTLADHFFMGAFGGSHLNHQWLICACTPRFEDAPAAMRVQLDAQGKLLKKPDSPSAHEGAVKLVSPGGGSVSPDGWSVNTAQPPYQPSGIAPADGGDPRLANPMGTSPTTRPLPPQFSPTIGDRLSDRQVTWAWYAGGYRAALAEGMLPASHKRRIIYGREPGTPMFQPHHQPFNYFARYAPGTAARERHLKDGEEFMADIDAGRLPAVSFYKPTGRDNQHPSYTDLVTGDLHLSQVLEKLRQSPQWSRMLVVVTYDENGGYWDHVPPPRGPGWSDRWGPGTRIPTLLIGPTVKRGFVDHTPYDTTSILKFLTRKFQLEPLPGVRENAGDLSAALQR